MSRFKKIVWSATPRDKGFSLAEVLCALAILALTSSSVLVVIHHNAASAADLTIRMRAFEIARENMEKLLTSNSVTEKTEYGISERYPDIQWQSTLEAFHEPVSKMMWIRAICSAEYTDINGELQTVKLTHWMTQLTREQADMLEEYREKEAERLIESGQIIEDIEEAALYVGVDVEIIRQWEANGMRKTKEGYYITDELDLYEQTNGMPTVADRIEAQRLKGGDDEIQDLFDDAEFDESMEPETDGSEDSEMGIPGTSEMEDLEALGL